MGPDRQGSRGTLRGAAQDRPRLFCGDPGLEDAGDGRHRNGQKDSGMRWGGSHDHHPDFL